MRIAIDEDKLLQKMENRIIKKIKVEDIFLLALGGKPYEDAKLARAHYYKYCLRVLALQATVQPKWLRFAGTDG